MGEAPNWAKARACNLAMTNAKTSVVCLPTDTSVYLHAFAIYIASKEEPPVDPIKAKLDAIAKEAFRAFEFDAEGILKRLEASGLKIVETNP